VELAPYDVAGSIAHARSLWEAGLLDDEQLQRTEQGLRQVAAEIADGTFDFQQADEDIHTAVERRLTELHPDAGSRLHAGRSRNDQVALDLRLYCRAASATLAGALAELVGRLAEQAVANAELGMPGYTHLQRAQPVTVGHHLLAHAEPLLRDSDRLRHAYEAADVMPLGAGALAGRTLQIPREVVARQLGFKALSSNSMDAVADRDFALDLVYACVSIGLHLSRLAEDIVLWATAEFGYLRLPDRVATGSSLMPQKKNPDIAELLRGRSGRALGSFTALATVLKGLPLAYDRDLQEDKVALFAAVGNALDCLRAMGVLVQNLEFDAERLAAGLADPALLATDSAEKLVGDGVAFREAHRRIAGEVRQGTHGPPWGAARSLELRGLAVPARARAAARRAAALARWSTTHPPPLPL
jgi:argininosuccinate lyase